MLLITGGPATARAATTAAGSSCTGTVTVNGPSVPMKITRPGQTAKRTFCGNVGERISVVITNPVTSDQGCETLILSGPGPTNVSQSGCGNGNAVGVGPIDLTAPGIYTVRLELDTTATGHATLWVSEPVTLGTVGIDKAAQPMNVIRVGQGVQRTFKGSVGQRVSVVVTNVITSDQGCETLTLSGPGGTNLSQSACGNGNPIGVGPIDLTAPGIYTASFEADVVATATSKLWVSTPRTVGTIGINKAAQPMNVIRVGQGVQRTFKGRRGQRVTAVINSVITSDQGCETLTLFGPGGTNVSQSACGNGNPIGVGPVSLPSTGIYTIRFEVDTTATGHGSLRVST
jgi:hypothetical protein